ncbi:MAG TPA: ribbon-helix-helix domain-containing protein [Gemmatimonadota bacterium]|nr:ribbon-helix-helix domain-containing protein [Gemmatimonadota bacterium]
MTRSISIRLPDDMLDRLDRLAAASGADRSALIRRAIREYLDAGQRLDRPWDRVRELAGSVYGGPPDLGRRHREHLIAIFRERR